MSLQAMSWALDYSESAGNDRLLVIIMCHHTDAQGFCGLSKATLSDETRLSESTVLRSQNALVQSGEIEPANIKNAPDWWLGIAVNRRPKLFRMVGFLRSQYGTPVEKRSRGVTGVAQGSHGGVTGVHDTPSDQGFSDVNREQRTENSIGELREKADPNCIPCLGSGWRYHATAGRDGPCECTKEYVA